MKKISIRKLIAAAVIVAVAFLCIALINNRPDINTEDGGRLFAELVAVDGIGEYLAGEIIRHRPYVSWDDLENRVDGVGEVRLKQLKAKFNLEE